jgi:hypothetical protein
VAGSGGAEASKTWGRLRIWARDRADLPREARLGPWFVKDRGGSDRAVFVGAAAIQVGFRKPFQNTRAAADRGNQRCPAFHDALTQTATGDEQLVDAVPVDVRCRGDRVAGHFE